LIEQFLVDSDGVITDMLAGFCKFHRLAYPHYPHDPDTQTEQTDYQLSTTFGKSRAELWAPLGFEFWANLKPFPWAHELIELLAERVGAENICLLTAPTEFDGCSDGKRAYIRRHFPQFEGRTLIGSAKEFCSSPTRALIDDYQGNIDKFDGPSFLFPAPYNASFRKHPMPALKEWLATLF